MLTLRIENFDQLPDGGPLEFKANRHGFDFGRDQHLDWTLPDQGGVISRKHCEVRFFEQAYWLFDLSTNGTFVNRSPKRVQSPYKLSDGDELRIGDYVISVSLGSGQAAPAIYESPGPSPSAPSYGGGSIWDSEEPPPPPIDPRELSAPSPNARRAPDYLHQFVQLPPVAEASYSFGNEAAQPGAADVWGAPPDEPAAAPPPPAPQPAQPVRIVTPPIVADELPFQAQLPLSGAPIPVTAEPAEEPPHQASREDADLLARLATGAGLPANLFDGRDAGHSAEAIGRLLNLFCTNLMALLNARAAAKALSRSGNRTLIRARDNNPLKFMPTAEDALRILLGPPTPAYLDAEKAVEGSFSDIRRHELALLAAMQRTASDFIEEISPGAIRKQAEANRKSLFGIGKQQFWESFVERWDARSAGKEHGMLTVFLDAFAQHYDRESGPKD